MRCLRSRRLQATEWSPFLDGLLMSLKQSSPGGLFFRFTGVFSSDSSSVFCDVLRCSRSFFCAADLVSEADDFCQISVDIAVSGDSIGFIAGGGLHHAELVVMTAIRPKKPPLTCSLFPILVSGNMLMECGRMSHNWSNLNNRKSS
jgi:hypothetical protein